MKNKIKLGKNFVVFFVAIAMVIGMFGFSTKIYAKESLESEIINPVYNENGELIEFTVILKDASPELLDQLYEEVESRNINLMTAQMNENGIVSLTTAATGNGVVNYVDGVCFVVELLSGYSCAAIARYLGLQLINGWYMYNGKRYTGKWKVTRGYIPGCEPRHSEGCFRKTYTKIA